MCKITNNNSDFQNYDVTFGAAAPAAAAPAAPVPATAAATTGGACTIAAATLPLTAGGI